MVLFEHLADEEPLRSDDGEPVLVVEPIGPRVVNVDAEPEAERSPLPRVGDRGVNEGASDSASVGLRMHVELGQLRRRPRVIARRASGSDGSPWTTMA